MPSNGYQRRTPSEQRKRRNIRFIIEAIVCTVLIAVACFVPIGFLKDSIQKQIMQKVTLQPDSDGYKTWLNPPVDTIRNYYLFNITNPIDVLTDPSKTTIHVQDTPPYAYNIKTNKNNIQWSNNNTRIDYEVERIITRHPEHFRESAVNEGGNFTDLLRATFRSTYEKKLNPSFYSFGGTNNAFTDRKPIELLEGFTSPLFETVRQKMIGPNTDQYGFVYRQNGSRLYSMSIETDLNKKGQVNTFSSDLVPFKIPSSIQYPFPVYDSVTYPPMLFDKPVLNIFHADFCMSILLQYSKTVNLYFGMPAFEYRVKFIDINRCEDPSNTTTCAELDKVDVSKCISDSLRENTIILSKAHFYGSQNETTEKMNIEGFAATAEKHDSVVYFEPYSGSPLKAQFRMQLNVDATIDPMNIVEGGSDLEPQDRKGVKRLVPVFWIDQDINLHQKKINELRKAIIVMNHGRLIFIGLAIILSICFIIIMELSARLCDRKNRNKHQGYVKADTLVYH